jgi:hypothetical protein
VDSVSFLATVRAPAVHVSKAAGYRDRHNARISVGDTAGAMSYPFAGATSSNWKVARGSYFVLLVVNRSTLLVAAIVTAAS